MAVLTVLHYPDPRLRKIAEPVPAITPEIQILIDDMFETMYKDEGIGLAATQVNVQLRIIVMDLGSEKKEPFCFINPEIIHADGHEHMKEGCLSVPDIYEEVERAQYVRVKALDRQGEMIEFDANGLMAVCIQHEVDHLYGKLFIDHLSNLKRERIHKKIEKLRKHRL